MTSYTECFEAALKHCGDPGVEARGSHWLAYFWISGSGSGAELLARGVTSCSTPI